MNCTCYDDKIEVVDNSTDNTTSNHVRDNQKLIGGLIFLGIYAALLLYGICWCIYLIYAKIRSYRQGPVTLSPVVPNWLGPRGPRRTRHYEGFGVVAQTRAYQIKFKTDKRDSGEMTQGAIEWIQRILKKRFGKDPSGMPNVYISSSTCLVSVPMENFECGLEPTDFEPMSGVAPGSLFTYQMCGDNRIQITRYVERGVAYVAGYCIYINDPNAWKVNYNVRHIQKCYKGPRYVLPGSQSLSETPRIQCSLATVEEASLDSEDDKNSDSDSDSDLQNTIPLLKAQYCKLTREPVLIGLESGILKHFQWNRDTRSFKTSECSSCQINDEPPAYHLLEV